MCACHHTQAISTKEPPQKKECSHTYAGIHHTYTKRAFIPLLKKQTYLHSFRSPSYYTPPPCASFPSSSRALARLHLGQEISLLLRQLLAVPRGRGAGRSRRRRLRPTPAATRGGTSALFRLPTQTPSSGPEKEERAAQGRPGAAARGLGTERGQDRRGPLSPRVKMSMQKKCVSCGSAVSPACLPFCRLFPPT